MSIVGSDPLAFLTTQGGVVGTPLTEAAASAVDNLDVQQRGAIIGEPIPIVFARRVSGVGGVLVSPPATEARFEDDASSNITARYHLVLSEGQIDLIQVRDVFQGACRVGSYTQVYNQRAGTFVPGNFIDNTPNLRAPTYCGTGGTYAGLSTMAFSVTIPAGFDQWNRQVYCFVRGGMYVPRLLDSVTGPSNNVADLLLYLMRNSSRVPEAMIDTASLLAAATFTNVNGFWFNGVISESTNLRDWIGNTLQYFLLRQARIGGKEAVKPLVQINGNGTIKTTAVTWAFTFTEEHVIPDSFDIIYTPLADRKPFCAVMLWRQQDDLGIPVMRTTEVRYTDTAVDGPFEQHDLSGFCSSENHAVKVGAYILAKRKHVTHRLQLGVRPDAFNPTLAAGDIVRVRLERNASTGASSLHDYLYEVDRIGKSLAGEIRLDLTHFPVDANRASVVALEVNAATGSGLTVGTGASAITCDINSFNDTSIPASVGSTGSFPNYGTSYGGFSESGLGDPRVDNPSESSLAANNITGGTGAGGTAQVGDTLSYNPGCPGAYIEWRLRDLTTGVITVVGSGISAGLTAAGQWVGNELIGVGKCPDGSSPTGYGPEIQSNPIKVGGTGSGPNTGGSICVQGQVIGGAYAGRNYAHSVEVIYLSLPDNPEPPNRNLSNSSFASVPVGGQANGPFYYIQGTVTDRNRIRYPGQQDGYSGGFVTAGLEWYEYSPSTGITQRRFLPSDSYYYFPDLDTGSPFGYRPYIRNTSNVQNCNSQPP